MAVLVLNLGVLISSRRTVVSVLREDPEDWALRRVHQGFAHVYSVGSVHVSMVLCVDVCTLTYDKVACIEAADTMLLWPCLCCQTGCRCGSISTVLAPCVPVGDLALTA